MRNQPDDGRCDRDEHDDRRHHQVTSIALLDCCPIGPVISVASAMASAAVNSTSTFGKMRVLFCVTSDSARDARVRVRPQSSCQTDSGPVVEFGRRREARGRPSSIGRIAVLFCWSRSTTKPIDRDSIELMHAQRRNTADTSRRQACAERYLRAPASRRSLSDHGCP
jgi:hypothetical protein